MGGDALHQGVGLGVHGGVVQGVVGLGHAQEAGRLLEGLGPQARYGAQLFAAGERAVLLAVGDDVAGEGVAEAGDARQQGHGGGVDVHPHGVHTVLHHRFQGLGQATLIDVVLVLADADGLGIDLHQFGEGVLQAPGDGDGAAQGHVQVGEFLRRQGRGGIDGGAGLGDEDLGGAAAVQAAQELVGEAVGLARGGAVADGDEVHPVPFHQGLEGVQGLVPAFLRRVRVDGGGLQKAAGGVHHRHLDAGAKAGVQTHDRLRAGGGGHEHVLEVGGEDGDGLLLGPFLEALLEFALQAGGQFDAPGVAGATAQESRPGSVVVGQPVMGQDGLGEGLAVGDGDQPAVFLHHQFQGEDAQAPPPQEGQGAVGGEAGEGFVVVEVVLELGGLVVLAVGQVAGEAGALPEAFAKELVEVGVVGVALHEDLAGALQGRLHVGYAPLGVHEVRRQGLRRRARVGGDDFGQGTEAGLARLLRLAAALGLVGTVEVLQAGLAVGGADGRLQLRGEAALGADGVEHRLPPRLQLAQVGQPTLQGAQLGVVQTAGDLLAVAGDEGDGGPFVQQPGGGAHLLRPHPQFLGDALENGSLHGHSGRMRIASISTRAPLGRAATPTTARAG